MVNKLTDRIRIQKAIADSGYCSRRKAEELIHIGAVTINGELAEIGQSVQQQDEIKIHGEKLKSQGKKIYIALNKPVGYTCTNRFFKGEKNIFDLVDIGERLFVVGRLDKNSRGLVILTNDGDYAQKTTHPRYEHEKVYVVTVQDKKGFDYKGVTKSITNGITDDEDFLIAKKVTYLGDGKFRVSLTQGKKRQLRRMFAALGLRVVDLERIQINDIKLGDIKEGDWQTIKIK